MFSFKTFSGTSQIGNEELDTLYSFLHKEYHIDDLFKFDYTKDLVKYFLNGVWVVTFVYTPENELVGCVCAKQTKLSINEFTFLSAEINFLCVAKKFRNCDLAIILIKEIESQIYKLFPNITVSNYTIYNKKPSHWSDCNYTQKKYYYRIINPKGLQLSGFVPDSIDTQVIQNYYSECNLKKYVLEDKFTYKITENGETEVCSDIRIEEYFFEAYHPVFSEAEKLLHFYESTSKKMYKVYSIMDLNDMLTLVSNEKLFDTWCIRDFESRLVAFFSFFYINRTNTETGVSFRCMYLCHFCSLIQPEDALEYIYKQKLKHNDIGMIVIPDIFKNNLENSKYITSEEFLNYYLFQYQDKNLQVPPYQNSLCTI